MARLAQERSSDNQVRAFAQRMIAERGEMSREWRALSARSGQQVSLELTPRYQQQIARLEALRGPEFDQAYASVMVQNHQDMVDVLQNGGRTAQSTEVRQLVNRSLPASQEHLSAGEAVEDRHRRCGDCDGRSQQSEYWQRWEHQIGCEVHSRHRRRPLPGNPTGASG